MTNITGIFAENADTRSLAPAAVGSQVGLMIVVSVRPPISCVQCRPYPHYISLQTGGHYPVIQRSPPEQ